MKVITIIPDATPTVHYQFSPKDIKTMIGKPVKDQDGEVIGKITDAYDVPAGVKLVLVIRDEERYRRILNGVMGSEAHVCPKCGYRSYIE